MKKLATIFSAGLLLSAIAFPAAAQSQSIAAPSIRITLPTNLDVYGEVTVGTASEVNSVRLVPATPGNTPELLVVGPDTNLGLTLGGQGTGAFTFLSPVSFSRNQPLSGSSTPPFLNIPVGNISGTYSGTDGLVYIYNNLDTAQLSGSQSTYPGLAVKRQFGGGATLGPRDGIFVSLTQGSAITADNSEYSAFVAFFTAQANAGGTAPTGGAAGGNGYAMYPQTWLQPGATNYNIASISESDIDVEASRQKLTVSGAVANGDVITLTFTSPSIAGSPVSVTYTAGTGNVAAHIVNGLMAAIVQNTALEAAGVSAVQDALNTTILDIVWQTTTTVTVSVATTGSETLALNAAVTGASTKFRVGETIARGDNDSESASSFMDVAFQFADLPHAARSGQWRTGIQFGGEGVWPLAYNSTIIGAGDQTILNVGSTQGMYSPPQTQYGIDWHIVNFSIANGASLYLPGFEVDGTGAIDQKATTITTDSTGLNLTVTGYVGSGNPTVVAGGGGGAGVLTGNYFIGDIVRDGYGGQYLVAGVNNSTGAVTALTTLVQPSTTGASWGAGIATAGGSGTGLTITPTAVAVNTISLNATGGLKINNTAAVSCSAGTVNLTTFTVTNGLVTHC